MSMQKVFQVLFVGYWDWQHEQPFLRIIVFSDAGDCSNLGG